MENQEKNHKRYCKKSIIKCAVIHPDGICPDAQKCEECELEDKQSDPLYRQGYEAGRAEERERILKVMRDNTENFVDTDTGPYMMPEFVYLDDILSALSQPQGE